MLATGSNPARLHPFRGLASVAALCCSSLEISLLKHVDAFSLYLTPWEIGLVFGAALIVLTCISVAWWSLGLLLQRIMRIVPWTNRHSTSLGWYLWLAVPSAYFARELFSAIRLLVSPHWYPGLRASLGFGLSLVVICIGGLSFFSLSKIQEFCRTRLAPVGWGHLALGGILLGVLWAQDVHPYHNLIGPGKPFAGSKSPDIYLISIDALRAEDMSAYGYGRATTPNLQRLAQRSFTFEDFVANSNFTTPTTVSIETGKLPWSHRVFQYGGFLRDSARQENLATMLRRRGYYTAMNTSNLAASPFYHNTVASYDAVEYTPPSGISGLGLRYSNLAGVHGQASLCCLLLGPLLGLGELVDSQMVRYRYPYPAEAVFDHARALLESHKNGQPLFVWTHILPPHDPYWPPAAYRMRFASSEKFTQIRGNQLPRGVTASDLRAQYDEMISYADQAVGDYLDWLDRTGRLDGAIVIITADHGESFEHNWFQHSGPYLYNGLIHIPLLIHLPGQEQGARISQLAQQADLLPTLADLVGTEVPSWSDGTSLKPILEGGTAPQRYVFTMSLASDRVWDPLSKGTIAVMDDQYKYIICLANQQQELYRYKTDPSEVHNVIDLNPDVAKRMREALLDKLKVLRERSALDVPKSGGTN